MRKELSKARTPSRLRTLQVVVGCARTCIESILAAGESRLSVAMRADEQLRHQLLAARGIEGLLRNSIGAISCGARS